MGSGSRDLPAVGSSSKLAMLELGSPFSFTGRTLVRLRKAEQYRMCLSMASWGKEENKGILQEVKCVSVSRTTSFKVDFILRSSGSPLFLLSR
uniref:Uncharacterized protein n=1 Tax=Lepeophtheirus salmonis TaxID=72036 RepID=A0A0K2VJM6_LEPSM